MRVVTELPNDVEVTSFFEKFRYIYIYGAGKYGKACANMFSAHNISFNGYVVSKKSVSNIDGYPVYSYDEIYQHLKSEDCLVFAMKKEYQSDVLRHIKDNFDGHAVNIIDHKLFKREVYRAFVELMEKLNQQYPPSRYKNNDFSNILVIRLDRMGDMIWTSAFFRELRGNFPNTQITVVCTTSNLQLLRNCPYVNKCIGYEYTFEEETGKMPISEIYNRAKKFAEERLRDINYDVVFLPRGIIPMDAVTNILLAVFSSAPVRIAGYYATSEKIEEWYRDIIDRLFSVVAEHRDPLHDVEKPLNILKAIGCKIESDYTEIWYQKNQIIADMAAERIYGVRSKFNFLVGVGLTSQSLARTWNPNNYKELFARIGEAFSVGFILLGGTEAQKEASIAFDDRYCVDFVGKTNLNDTMQLISICDIYVGSNTGLEHMAAALKKPVIEISVSFPWGDDNEGLSPRNCGAWKTKYAVIRPEEPKDERCAKAGYCINEVAHCINNVSVDSVQKVLAGFIKYYDWS